MTSDPGPRLTLDELARLDGPQLSAVRRLLGAAEAIDGVAALNEQALLAIEADESAARHLFGTDPVDNELVAYLHLDLTTSGTGAAAECVVHPERRHAGWGGELVRRAVELARAYPLLMWAHGDHPGAARLAERFGFARVRELWQMRRDLAAPLPAVEIPADVSLRTFRVGADESEWLALNARAFAHHPEQGSLQADDLARRIGAPWFDAAGFFLAERQGRLAGFHWTKVHPAEGGQPPVGEVYVVGVDPDAQGGGLGRALTLAGLHHLRDRGLSEVLLYVEADNLPARGVYERLGFTRTVTDVQYLHLPG